jgi:hypothetical protein
MGGQAIRWKILNFFEGVRMRFLQNVGTYIARVQGITFHNILDPTTPPQEMGTVHFACPVE